MEREPQCWGEAGMLGGSRYIKREPMYQRGAGVRKENQGIIFFIFQNIPQTSRNLAKQFLISF
jgi:hypothetical protein